ncbi:hypothetical protein TrST_g1111 [Triparma strigata]|uniref:Tyrosine specific protein phosphatases domain-containing protein n=1 Tax=Triparma strigata TaxID=1606541 RepID=A0A9W7AG12_9STRA|nr:hypothetical protein TrST_g1111 [Triparma strigata]
MVVSSPQRHVTQLGTNNTAHMTPLAVHPDRVLAAPFQKTGVAADQTAISITEGEKSAPLGPNANLNSSSLTPQKRPAGGAEAPSAKKRSSELKPLTGLNDRLFPALELYDVIEQKREEYVGPTTESNWVLPGKLLCGAYPGVEDDDENMTLLWSILNCGITTFCCLQVEYPGPEVTEQMWRSGQAIRPYYNDVVQIIDHVDNMRKINPQAQHEKVTNSDNLDFVHIPIVDCSVTDDTTIINLCQNLVDRIAKGETIYLHCWGGHGRTGTAICIMLHMMYGMKSGQCLKYCQFVHDLRRIPIAVGSPQTQMQRDQVIRVIAFLEKKKKEEEEVQRRERTNSLKRDSSISPSNKAKKGSPSKGKSSPGKGAMDGFEIHNGSNGQSSGSGDAPSVEAADVGGRRSRIASNTGGTGNSGKKSLRQLREQSREKRREVEKTELPQQQQLSDNDMLISGLQLVKVKEASGSTTNTPNTPNTTSPMPTSKDSPSKEKTAESTPDNSPPMADIKAPSISISSSSSNRNSNSNKDSSKLPLVVSNTTNPNTKNTTPDGKGKHKGSNSNGKVDEIMMASPVGVSVKPIKPMPPSGGKNRGTFQKRVAK